MICNSIPFNTTTFGPIDTLLCEIYIYVLKLTFSSYPCVPSPLTFLHFFHHRYLLIPNNLDNFLFQVGNSIAAFDFVINTPTTDIININKTIAIIKTVF